MNKLVVACLTSDDLRTIQQLSGSADAQVIAVALDLGHGVGLRALHDCALAAGAARCHALDLREAFARECVLPALGAPTLADMVEEMEWRARNFVAKNLTSIAALEGDAEPVAAPSVRPKATARTSTPSPGRPAQVNISFDQGVPCSVNGIPMSTVEVLDSLGAIGAAHGVDGSETALHALHAAHRELRPRDRKLTGSVQLEISRAGISNVQVEYGTA